MRMKDIVFKSRKVNRAFAWAAHTFTASGLIFGFLGLIAILNGEQALAFLFMGFALIIDGVDGTLARYVNVEEALPEVDGSTLDNIIDMFNYSILPVLMIYWFAMVPYNLVYLTCISILLASCYTFSDKNMKTTDYYFKGFSALWNLLVFFLFILDLGLWFNFGAICLCLILTFIPIKIIHPFRVKELRNSSIMMVGVWSISAFFLILHKHSFLLHQFYTMIFGLWLISTAYFVWISLRRSFKQNT